MSHTSNDRVCYCVLKRVRNRAHLRIRRTIPTHMLDRAHRIFVRLGSAIRSVAGEVLR